LFYPISLKDVFDFLLKYLLTNNIISGYGLVEIKTNYQSGNNIKNQPVKIKGLKL
jgi:hypothetical protein